MASHGYRGAQWPLDEMWTNAYGGDVQAAFDGHQAVRNSLRDQFDQRVAEVKEDKHLTALGQQHKLRQLAAEYREHRTVKQMQAALGKLRAREQSIRTELASRPQPELDKLPPYQAVSLAMAESRAIARFEALDPSQRLQAVRIAGEKGDTKFLALILREPALLPERVAKSVELALMKDGNPDRWRELEHLVGKYNGTQPDALSGIIPCAGDTLDNFLTHIDEAVGIPPGETDALAAIKAGTTDDAITLSQQNFRNAQIYQLAKSAAAASGKELRVENDDVAPGEFAPVTADGGK
jgi:hypothetical protein